MLYDFFYDLTMIRVILKMNDIKKELSAEIQNMTVTKTKKKCTLQLMQHNLYIIKTKNIFCSFSRLFIAAETSAEIILTLELYYTSH